MRRFVVLLFAFAACAHAGTSLVATTSRAAELEPPDAGSPAETGPCAADDAVLYFHGRGRQGLEVASEGICAPRLEDDGAPGFWADETALVSAPGAAVVAGFSAGRIPLLRRLKDGSSGERVAALIDPSWADGPRFDGATGPDIVARWLEADDARAFVLIYSPDAAGHAEYRVLADGPLSARIRVCAVPVPHAEVPAAVGSAFLRDPLAWIASACPAGTYTPGDADASTVATPDGSTSSTP